MIIFPVYYAFLVLGLLLSGIKFLLMVIVLFIFYSVSFSLRLPPPCFSVSSIALLGAACFILVVLCPLCLAFGFTSFILFALIVPPV